MKKFIVFVLFCAIFPNLAIVLFQILSTIFMVIVFYLLILSPPLSLLLTLVQWLPSRQESFKKCFLKNYPVLDPILRQTQ
ncbi:MAG: hypothetical protein A2736_01500 [Candidatus Yanofskybacteria bacterium RIFCSPHIGHO2_01_FULL_41_27]|uniref:Uncharacterized protein n=1 Tax=Candidatus Yanofskybacteria bacterium RIFCSPHIGHO2_01_FULL_41_27 TaxID=1802662 RepID=A0A1F8EHR8_9BACT|nr:MAG: hypothetical protein A2736_01500 [Candidatus Yanofskybacteria bacterium RIFCSPHIGHO2_01_FULL_41_27]